MADDVETHELTLEQARAGIEPGSSFRQESGTASSSAARS
jgi:hypothetical protein